jgi:hypothetical protein
MIYGVTALFGDVDVHLYLLVQSLHTANRD